MSLYVHRPTVTDPTVAPDGRRHLLRPLPGPASRASPTPWTGRRGAEPYRAKVADGAGGRCCPGLASTCRRASRFTPDDFRDRYCSPYGCGFSIEPRILQSAWFRPHNVSEEVRGLYLVGAGTHPGAGLPGVIASAEVLGKLVPDAAPGAR